MRKQDLSLKILILTLIGLMVFGCEKKGYPKNQNRYLRVCLSSPIRSLDPRVGIERPSVNVIQMLFEGLMTRDASGNLTEGLAKKIELSEDQKTYTFYLRPSHWSNGTPVTAKDFEYAWKKAINPATAQISAFHFACIKNAAACSDGNVPIHKVGINALDDQTLEVELEHPTPYFLELLACVSYAPVPSAIVEEDEEWAHCNKSYLISNGPFIMAKWDKGKSITLEKNAYYWNAEKIHLPGINLYVVPETSIRHFMYEHEQVDWIGDPISPLSHDVIETYQIKNNLNVSDVYGINWLFINSVEPPLNNKNFRKALAYALNRKEIVKSIPQTRNQASCRVIPHDYAKEEISYFQDNDQARALLHLNSALAELGIDLSDLPEITLSYPSLGDQPQIVHLVQRQWEEVLGIKVKLDPQSKPLLMNELMKGGYQVCSMFWTSMIKDPVYLLSAFRSVHGHANLCRWVNEDYQRLLYQADAELNPEKRRENFLEVEKLLMDELPVIPISFGTALYMKDEKLENVSVSPLMEVNFKYATFVDK